MKKVCGLQEDAAVVVRVKMLGVIYLVKANADRKCVAYL